MRKIYALLLMLSFFVSGSLIAQNVTVNPGAGSYATLKAAFDAINSGSHTGAVTISVIGNTTETAPAVLNASGAGSANYASIVISPSGGAARTISGAIVAGSPLLDLNGADNVTIDGLNSGGNSLTISNTTVSATANTCTIRFTGDATSNTINRCSVLGSATVPLATNGGNIYFATAAASGTGNDNNTISNCNIGPAGSNLPSKGIYANGTTTNAGINNSGIVISDNNIFDYFLTGGCAGIYALTGNTEWTITNNKVYQTATRTFTATGTMFGIYFVSATHGDNVQITNNTIGYASNTATGTLTLTGSGFAGAFTGIQMSVAATTTVDCNINDNIVSNISLTSSTGACYGIYNSTTGTTANTIYIDNNNVRNIDVQTSTGLLYGIWWTSAQNIYITGNNVNSLTRNTAGTTHGITSGSSSVNEYVNNNTIFNLSNSAASTSTVTIRGINQGTALGIKEFKNNAVFNLSVPASTATANLVEGIRVNYGTTIDISGNLVYGISGNITTIAGIGGTGISAGGVYNIYKNKIYDLSTTSTSASTQVVGINRTSQKSLIYNNIIGDLRVTAASSTDAIRGISVTGVTALTNHEVYFNTIYLNAVNATGTDFGTSGIYHGYSATATTGTLILNNNIIYNSSTPKGSGKTAALRRSAATDLNNYSSTSDNNLFFAGTPSNERVLFFDGTNFDPSLAALKTRVSPAENNSIREDAPFVSTTGSNPTFLHINPATPTQIESGGINVGGIIDDFDGDARGGTPDIGADEFNGTPALPMTYVSTATTQQTGAAYAGINDQTILRIDVVTSGALNPLNVSKFVLNANGTTNIANLTSAKVYYTGGANVFSTSTLFGSAVPTIANFNVLGSQNLAEGTNYFWLVYDVSVSAANGNIIDGEYVNATINAVVRTPAVSAPAGNKVVLGPMSGNYNIGAAQTFPNFPTIKDAVNDLNLRGVSAAVTFTLLDPTYSTGTGETFPITITSFVGASASNTLTIKPGAGVNAVVTGSVASGALIRLSGTSYVIIDGSNNGTTSRNLTITNSNTTAPSAVGIVSLGAGLGTTFSVVKNCNINVGVSTTIGYGVAVGGATPGATGADNDNITIENNSFTNCAVGIYAIGTAAVSSGGIDNLIINRNILDYNGTLAAAIAIRVGNTLNSSISQNTINFETSATSTAGISLETGANNIEVNRNLISKVKSTNSAGSAIVRGIVVGTAQTGSAITISNNVIYNVIANWPSSTVGFNHSGIVLGAIGISTTMSTVTGGVNMYFNSVNLSGNSDRSIASLCMALHIGTAVTSLDIRNNVFANSSVNINAGATSAKSFAIYSQSANTGFTDIDYNDYFASGTQAVLGFLTSDRANIAAWQTATGKDAMSISADPIFNSNTNLIPNSGSPLIGAGVDGTGITIDFNGAPRNNPPTIGAYSNAGDFAPPVITYTPFGNTSCFIDRTLSSVTITDASGVNNVPGTKPRLYYKRSTTANAYAGNTSGDNGWKYVEATNSASPYSFTMNYSILFGAAPAVGDVIQYFVVAQDMAGTPNVGINSGIFNTTPSSAALGTGAFPITGTINQFTLTSPGLSGTVTIGATGQSYTSITGAGGLFSVINAIGLNNNLTVNIVDLNVPETGANALNSISSSGCAGGPYTLIIKPTGTSTLSGSVGSGALIKINGASNVTIDGSNSGGTDRSLTITNTSTTSPTAISMVSLGIGLGASNNTIKNCNISTGLSTATGFGISVGGNTPGTTGADNDNVTILNNNITVATVGVYAFGTASVSAGGLDNLLISSNSISNNTTIQTQGIQVGNALTSSITRNTLSIETSGTGQPVGISLETGFVSSSVTRNLISKVLTTATGGYGGRGITIGTGTATSNLTIANNVIYGVNGSNWSTFGNSSSMGIAVGIIGGSGTLTTTTGGVNIYFNSVNMFGSMDVGSATAITTALYVGSGATNLNISNNAFVNTQVGTATGQKNYAIYSVAANTAFTTINYNDYFVSNSFNPASAILGFLTSDRTDLAGIQAGFGQNANSIAVDPLFNSNTNLLPGIGSPLIGAGVFGTGVTEDFLGSPRNNPPAIGAYSTVGDFAGPSITYTLLPNTASTANRVTTNFATITDPSGVNTTAGTKPRMYYKRLTDGNVLGATNTNTTDGWKWVEATNAANPFDFTIDYSRLNGGGGVIVGNSIQYFVVAQDLAPSINVGVNSATFSANPVSVSLTSGAFPVTGTINQYSILPTIGGTLNVGPGETYTSLTAAGGLFEAINASVVSGNITAIITGDVAIENGVNALKEFAESGAGNYTLTIQPSVGSARVVSGTNTTVLIPFDGAKRVTINGLNAGPTMLTIRNAGTSGAVIRFINGASNNTVSNSIIEGGNTSTVSGLIVFGTSTGSVGNNNNTISNNTIRDRTDVTGVHAMGIYAAGSVGALNSTNTISGNRIINFSNTGISITATGNGNSWTISGNHFYNNLVTVPSTAQTAINLASATSTIGMIFSGNFIGGNAPNVAGTWTNSGNVVVTGIIISNGIAKVEGNKIANFIGSSTLTTARIRGINNSSPNDGLEFKMNEIYNISSSGAAIGIAGNSQVVAGINHFPATIQSVIFSENTIYNLSAANTSALTTYNMAVGIFISNFSGECSKNKIYNISNKGTGTNVAQPPMAVGIYTRSVSGSNLFVNNFIALGEGENTNTQFAGIFTTFNSTSNSHNYVHNTIRIGGTATGTNNSYGYVRGEDSTTQQVQNVVLFNNIIYMERVGGGSVNYAIANKGAQAGAGWTSDWNNIHDTSKANIGLWNATGYDLAGWKAISAGAANTRSLKTFFVNPAIGDLHLTGTSIGNNSLRATPLAPPVLTDIDGDLRNSLNPYMGADEQNVPLPVKITYFNGYKQGSAHMLNWKVTCNTSIRFEIERSADARKFTQLGTISASALDCNNPFNFADNNPLEGINYYRIRIIEANGNAFYSTVVALINKKSGFEIVGMYPTVVTEGKAVLNTTAVKNTNLFITITDVSGRVISNQTSVVNAGSGLISLDLNNLPAGMYQVTGRTEDNYIKTIRFVKQ